jgi:hypothetical protein
MKRTYEIPSVELTQVAMTSIVMAGSTGVTITGESIPTGEGGD